MHSRATRHLERTEVSGMELDYMMALCVKFERTSEKMEKLRAELDKHHDTIAQLLGEQHKKELLRLYDCICAIQEQAYFDGFVEGFKVASGICRELSYEKPYSFAEEEELRARGVDIAL